MRRRVIKQKLREDSLLLFSTTNPIIEDKAAKIFIWSSKNPPASIFEIAFVFSITPQIASIIIKGHVEIGLAWATGKGNCCMSKKTLEFYTSNADYKAVNKESGGMP